MIKPLISVVTVSYNAATTIEQTILSVLNQTYDNVEYIIIDGGSTDGTVDIIKKYADKIAYWVSEPDNGIYDAMNKGVLASTGEWLIFMNAGDTFFNENVLEKMVKHLNDKFRILRGNIIRIYNLIGVKSCGVTSQQPDLIDMFDNTFHHQACLIQRSLFIDFGLYSTDFRLVSDWKFFFDCTILHHVPSRYVDVTVAKFQMDGASSRGVQKCADERRSYLIRLYGEELFHLFEELSVYRKSSIIRCYFTIRKRLINGMSPKMFNRLLTLKRIFRSLTGRKVN